MDFARRSALPATRVLGYKNGAEELHAVNTARRCFVPALRALGLVFILVAAAPAARAQLVADGATNVLDNATNVITGGVTVGTNGSFTLLTLTNGALLTNSGGTVVIGRNLGANSNVIEVVGANTRWLQAGSSIVVGSNGAFNKVLVADGGRIMNGYCWIGNQAGANSNHVLVTGADSVLTNSGYLLVGYASMGNTVCVSNSGRVANDATYLGFTGVPTQADGNEIMVTGSGSLWVDNLYIVIGTTGSSSKVRIENGGYMTNQSAFIGFTTGSSNNQAIVSGTNSVWSNRLVQVGSSGSFNTVLVSNAGRLVTARGFIGGAGMGSSAIDNQVVVTGAGSHWASSIDLRIGEYGSLNTLLVTDGGAVESAEGYLGYYESSTNNLAVVTGAGSRWNMTGDLYVGEDGGGNTITIRDGGSVTNNNAKIGSGYYGSDALGNFNEAWVMDSDSVWKSHGDLSIGLFGSGNRLTITNGGRVENQSGYISTWGITSSNNEALVTGIGSQWRNSLDLYVGYSGRGSRLLISNGGTVQAASVFVGFVETSTNNLLRLANGTVTVSGGLTISTNNFLAGHGTINGSVTNFGTLDVGSSAGAISVNGDVQFEPSGTAIFELGGTTPTNGYDQLAVSNFVRFGGTLDLRLTNGFLPSPGDTFTLVKFATSFGIFNGVSNGQRINFLNGKISFFVNYDNHLVLSAVQYRDSDGDGQGDLQEEAAGTDPNDPASVLAVTSITESGNVVVQFRSVAGKTYRIEHSTSVGLWSIATTNVPATGTNTTWIDDGSLTGGLPATNRFYRVGLQ